MDKEKKEKICGLLNRLKKIHLVYTQSTTTEEQRGRLLEASQTLIDQLVLEGYSKEFLVTLLIGGEDFLNSIYKVQPPPSKDGEADELDYQLIFNRPF